ncbi:MAG TPA: hypothetical protein VF591_05880 [Pyrinomonadaceae bacterium]|jgi:hypothetical protein
MISREQESLTVSLSGDADLLVTDPAGRRIGYDATKQVSLDETPGALENPVLGEVVGEGDEDGSYEDEECEEVEDEEPSAKP